jgi:hypothetical protein
VRVVIGASFSDESVSYNGEPGFAEKGDESFPIFVGNLSSFESVSKAAIFLRVVVTLINIDMYQISFNFPLQRQTT